MSALPLTKEMWVEYATTLALPLTKEMWAEYFESIQHDNSEIESPMRKLVDSINIWELPVDNLPYQELFVKLMRSNCEYMRTSVQATFVACNSGDVLDEVRLSAAPDEDLYLQIGNVKLPQKLHFDGLDHLVAKINPPIFLGCLPYQTVKFEDNREATWITGVLKDRPKQGQYFYEYYDDNDMHYKGLFGKHSLFKVDQLVDASTS